MSLVRTINFTDIPREESGGDVNSEFTENTNVNYNGTSINTHRITPSESGFTSTQITFEINRNNFNNVLKNDNDLIRLNFDVYVSQLESQEIAECTIDGDVVLYQEGHSSNTTDKISVNYLIKSSRIANLKNNSGSLDILFKIYDSDDANTIGIYDYIYIDREIKVYAIYKPEFSSITGSDRTVDSTMTLDDSFDASSNAIANTNACEIKGPTAGTSSGSVTFNIKDKLLDGYPVSLFFNLNIESFQDTDSLKIQIDNGSGTYVDYFEISQNANNNILKTFFYSQTENYISSNDFNIRFNLSGNIENNDYVYFENMFTYIPEAINFFDSDVSVNGNVDVSGLIYKTGVVGEIGMFYEESPAPPFGYLWCDGTQITTNSSTTGGDEKYRNLIEVLQGVNKNSTTGTQSAYLPNLVDCYALGGSSSSDFSAYNSANENDVIDSTNTLDINHYPSHNHSSNTIEYQHSYDSANNPINILIGKTTLQRHGNVILSGYTRGEFRFKGNSGNNLLSVNDANNNVGHAHVVNINNILSSNNANIEYKYKKQNNGLSYSDNVIIGNTGNGIGSINYKPKSQELKAAIRYL